MENLKEKFELNDEALEQVTGGSNSNDHAGELLCGICRKYLPKDSTEVTYTTSGIPVHSCGHRMIEVCSSDN